MDINTKPAVLVEFLKGLGRNRKGSCEPTLVITESEAAAIINALTLSNVITKKAAQKPPAVKGKQPE